MNHGPALISSAILEYPGHRHYAKPNCPCSAGRFARRPKRCRKPSCIWDRPATCDRIRQDPERFLLPPTIYGHDAVLW